MPANTFEDILKFNPYHDSKGRFASADGAASFTYAPGKSTAHSRAIDREKERANADTSKGFKGTLYHGSPATDIKEFDMSRAGANTSSGEKLIYFTDSKQMADDFSYERLDGSSKFFQRRGKKGRVYEVDVEMKNPLDFRNLSDKDVDNILKLDTDGVLTKDLIQSLSQNHQLLKASLDLRAERLKKLGYDGLIANTGKAGHNSLEYAVVDSKQAKIKKSVADREDMSTDVTKETDEQFSIYKTDDDKRLVFGWASVVINVDGEQIEDSQQDLIDPEDLEEAAYEYVLYFRDTGEEHIPTMRKKGKLVESCVLTAEKQRAMGIPEGILPIGWWVGFKIEDDKAWELVKNGTYRMFSIEGRATREPVAKSTEPVAKTFDEIIEIEKFNPYHDEKGRFATANGYASFTIRTKDPKKQHMADMAVAREKERAGSSAAKPTNDGNKRIKDAEAKISSMLSDNAKVNLEGIDPDMADSVAKAIESVITKYPSVKDAFGGFTTEDSEKNTFANHDGVMACYVPATKMIHLNKAYYNDKAAFEKRYAEAVERQHFPKGTTADSVVVHEMGHAIDMYVSLKVIGQYKVYWGGDRVSARFWNNDIKAGKKSGNPVTGKSIMDGLSRYAGKNSAEYLAEGFAEYMTSSSPRPMAAKIGKRLETYIKKAEKEG